MRAIQHWIDGRFVEPANAATLNVYDPATGSVTGKVACATQAEVDAAVAAAKVAFGGWSTASLARRTRVLFAFRELLERHKTKLAELITAEHGKVASDALGEVNRGLEVVEFACGIAHLSKGEFSENVSSDVDSYSIRQPLGVTAGITPFNFPAMVPMWMYPIAIACGNTFVLKPSERDPSPVNFCAELLHESGLPPGVFNVVHGDAQAVQRLLEHPDVAAISFVGSTPVARHVYVAGTAAGKRVQALGGAKNHMIVLGDADMELAADAAIGAAYGSAGERCMAISVLVAVGDAGDKLVPLLRARLATLRVGPGSDPTSQMGPLVTKSHLERVKGWVDTGVAEGAQLVVDGRKSPVPLAPQGFFMAPCLLDHVTSTMEVYRQEIFGPVLCVVRVATYQDAVDLVHGHRFGNGVAIFTRDGAMARRFQSEIQVGMVGINVPIPVPMAYYSFGGWKASLFGDTHVHGREGVHFYTRGKVVTARWPAPQQSAVDLGFPQNR